MTDRLRAIPKGVRFAPIENRADRSRVEGFGWQLKRVAVLSLRSAKCRGVFHHPRQTKGVDSISTRLVDEHHRLVIEIDQLSRNSVS